jgi:hypothetical protein
MPNFDDIDYSSQCGKDPDHVSTNASGGRKNKLQNISNTKNSLAST